MTYTSLKRGLQIQCFIMDFSRPFRYASSIQVAEICCHCTARFTAASRSSWGR